MKKALLFLIFAVGVNSSALLFSDGPWLSESWASLGYEYGHFFEEYSQRGKKAESYTASQGINFGGYRFWYGKNVGIFIHGLIGTPLINVFETDGVTKRIDSDDFAMTFQTGLLIGPGFRVALDERINFKFAIGLSFLSTLLWYTEYTPGKGDAQYSIDKWSFGIGGEIGVKINLTDTVFLNAGNIMTVDFLSRITMDTLDVKYSGWARDFFMLSARPYIAIGMNLHWE
ncbi:MAG: hypothetical protein LBQ93_04695 [Treponema sp.]|jgi:hypothetical protein|nr:hypothetical protein [Treponema sp.]